MHDIATFLKCIFTHINPIMPGQFWLHLVLTPDILMSAGLMPQAIRLPWPWPPTSHSVTQHADHTKSYDMISRHVTLVGLTVCNQCHIGHE